MKLIILTLFTAVSISWAMRQQAVGVKGKLLCGTRPAEGVLVKLWDEDDGPDPDDELAQGYTDEQGSFELKGSTRELTSIDPVFKVYHNCGDKIKVGQRKVKFHIPSQYIVSGTSVPKKLFDIGIVNLEVEFPGEEPTEGITSIQNVYLAKLIWEVGEVSFTTVVCKNL